MKQARLALPLALFACSSLTFTTSAEDEVPDFRPGFTETAEAELEADRFHTYDLMSGSMITIEGSSMFHKSYGEKFAKQVYDAAYETTGEPAGKGLVVVGNSKDPHPFMLLKKYLEFAAENDSEADLSIFGSEKIYGQTLEEMLAEWEKMEAELKKELGQKADFEVIANVIPTPLIGPLNNLYQIAQDVDFDDEKLNEIFANLTVQQLATGDYEQYEWSIYLPPKNAIDKVIRTVLPAAMKKEGIGPVKRALVRGAVFTFKPLIRDAVEGFRKGMLYRSILKATSDLSDKEIERYANAYQNAIMPKGKLLPGGKKDRSIEAIRKERAFQEEYRKDPYITPTEFAELSQSLHPKFEGIYKNGKYVNYVFFSHEGKFYSRRGRQSPVAMVAVSDYVLAKENGSMTFEFFPDENGGFHKMEARREYWRRTCDREADDPEKMQESRKKLEDDIKDRLAKKDAPPEEETNFEIDISFSKESDA